MNKEDRLRARRHTLSKRGKERAETRRCPKCARGNAIVRKVGTDGLCGEGRCRWCDYRREWDALSALTSLVEETKR